MTGTAALTAPRLAPSEGRAIIRRHSRSFSLASLLLGEETRDDAVALYAYCRRADDAVDTVGPDLALGRVGALERELDDVYAGRSLSEPVLAEFQRLVFERGIPREYPGALLQGMRDDAEGVQYRTLPDLLRYCWYVAGSVGGMMCHVLGVRRERAIVNGVHLGMGMQLTNVCRDVAEDFARGRLYVPLELVPELEGIPVEGEIRQAYVRPLGRAVRHLLKEADAFYRSGDAGLPYLSPRSRLAVATARRVYSAIGGRILETGADVLAARAVVPPLSKLGHVAAACAASLQLSMTAPRFQRARLAHPLRFPEDVLPR